MAERDTRRQLIDDGKSVLGIELGSTRIKAVLVDANGTPLASGAHGWENSQVDGIWTYSDEDIWAGIAACYADLSANVEGEYGVKLTRLAAAGVSAMMHGYLAFGADDKLLVPFRTWRNNITGEAAGELTSLLDYPIPQRWSIAHLHHAVVGREAHVGRIASLTTLAGYVHWKLTGQRVLGIGDASGMFPVDAATGTWDQTRLSKYEQHAAVAGQPWSLRDLLPRVVPAGESAGSLTDVGARLLDPTGTLAPGVPFCPPEGDAETGMVATNSIKPRTGNVSAGTSVFAMIVLERPLAAVHEEIDLVMTPDGNPVAMAHSNNCTSDYDAWISLLGEAARELGAEVDDSALYQKLLPTALTGDADAGGLLSYGYVSGEHITGFSEGRPLFVRSPGATFTLANFMRAHLFSALCALRIGLDILLAEGARVEEIRGHGGFFKTDVGARVMSAATGTPVSLPESAGEGGAWGMALLAAYAVREERNESLADFLDRLLSGSFGEAVAADANDMAGFNVYLKRYRDGLPVEKAAVESIEQQA